MADAEEIAHEIARQERLAAAKKRVSGTCPPPASQCSNH